ncbi:class I SAM-dependent methyltransferase [Flaviflexus huanghaiensis]|uniref:class I SAM-dependent methyltransferase n=1 Tax=Flaviflexus huanghaiensis TaxID=1111473 RepID=UPI0015F84F24|nr:class I SAM-dependent methyltransferase [Flaviflexus huanghaiensis]
MNRTPDEEQWDARYGSSRPVWSGSPNPLLMETAQERIPGVALDIGAGEGADAIWLAERGWTVHAVDLSSVALASAASHAEAAGVEERIKWMHRDVEAWSPQSGAYDLVSVHFLHLPSERREKVFRGLGEAVAPGGTLLIVGHHPSDLNAGVKRPSGEGLLFTPESVAELFDSSDWETLACEARPRTPKSSDGRETTVHDSLFYARRRHR